MMPDATITNAEYNVNGRERNINIATSASHNRPIITNRMITDNFIRNSKLVIACLFLQN